MPSKQQAKKDFLDHRTSWRFFERILTDKGRDSGVAASLQGRILNEILKELQFMNDRA